MVESMAHASALRRARPYFSPTKCACAKYCPAMSRRPDDPSESERAKDIELFHFLLGLHKKVDEVCRRVRIANRSYYPGPFVERMPEDYLNDLHQYIQTPGLPSSFQHTQHFLNACYADKFHGDWMRGFDDNITMAIDADVRDLRRPWPVVHFYATLADINRRIRHDASFFSLVFPFIVGVKACLTLFETSKERLAFPHTDQFNTLLSYVVRLIHSLEQSSFLKAHFPETYHNLDALRDNMSRAKKFPMKSFNASQQPLQSTLEREAAQVKAFMKRASDERAAQAILTATGGSTAANQTRITRQLAMLRLQ
jgi:hypothetical protein